MAIDIHDMDNLVPQETDTRVSSADENARFREIVSILSKHDLIRGLTPVKLRLVIEDLGPTFVKIGQIMSMRPDMIPQEYCTELAKLRSDVEPMTYEQVEEALHSNYGEQLDEIFSEVDKDPLGSASIAQAHAATLKTGEKVVLKIQRPGIYETMAKDISLLRRASRFLKIAAGPNSIVDFRGLIDEMWAVAQEEMDFLVEAKNAKEFASLNEDAERIEVPHIFDEYTSSKVLCMEFIDGISVADIDALDKAGYDREDLGTILVQNYIKQVTEDGFFHADPHPGNIWVRNDDIVWIDLGMMGRLSARDRQLIEAAIEAVASGDVNALKDVVLTLGVYKGQINHPRLYSEIDAILGKYGTSELSGIDMGTLADELLTLCRNNGISMPSNISMLVRGVATIEGTMTHLSPDLSVSEILGQSVRDSMLRNFDPIAKAEEVTRKVYRSGSKSVEIPGLATDLMKMIMRGQIKVNMEMSSASDMTESIHNSVDKIVAGLVTSAFLIGSSFLCTTDMEPKILGVPALGAIGFAIALVLGAIIIIDMLRRR